MSNYLSLFVLDLTFVTFIWWIIAFSLKCSLYVCEIGEESEMP